MTDMTAPATGALPADFDPHTHTMFIAPDDDVRHSLVQAAIGAHDEPVVHVCDVLTDGSAWQDLADLTVTDRDAAADMLRTAIEVINTRAQAASAPLADGPALILLMEDLTELVSRSLAPADVVHRLEQLMLQATMTGRGSQVLLYLTVRRPHALLGIRRQCQLVLAYPGQPMLVTPEELDHLT